MRANRAVIIALFIGLHVSLFGKEFSLSPSFFNSLQTEKSKAIFKDYERFMNETAPKPLHIKLEAVNFYMNAFVGSYDEQTYQTEDFWATRAEFLSAGQGDCEDYAIAKYETLKDFGIKPKQMGVCIVKERSSQYYHMVLLFWQATKVTPMVLDNLSFKVLPLDARVDLSVEQCMNEEGYFKLDTHNQPQSFQSHLKLKAYERVKQQSAQEHIWQKSKP